ncbi:hypothetical protein [Sphingomonas edaphi]|uniref:Uncharacterized protein n=1 Tax=Sphingomonas edaphi TaxID=2315689 RepID=A0A418Q2R0_9SPHN|nr:hypothetical protein [Sphingomonas edaphi]RIX32131.1 hypothetical protein D3M59_03935 [Sphingomonas edaphi]
MLAFTAISLLAISGAASAGERLTGEAELAKLLEGRVAERPVSCIRDYPSGHTRAIDGTALVFGTGSVIYVNRTRDPRSIDDDNALVIRKSGTGAQLCNSDIVTTMNSGSHFYTGNVFLTEFVPYRRVKR